MVDQTQKDLVQRLLVEVSRAVQWAPGGDPADRFARAIAAYRLDLDLGDMELSAWLTEEVDLAIWVHVRRAWSPAVQRALSDALEKDGSIVAALLLADWENLTATCASANTDPHPRADADRERSIATIRRRSPTRRQ